MTRAACTAASPRSRARIRLRPATAPSTATASPTMPATSPYSTPFDTTGLSDGLYDFRAVATDIAGNVEPAPVPVLNRRIDNTPPSATMLSPGNPVRGTVTLTSTTSDTGGSGIATEAYQIAPSGGSFTSQPASWD